MTAFLDALCDDNIQSLVIDGKVTSAQLSEAWILILAEYHELKDNGIEGSEQFSLSRDILKLNNHLRLIDICVQFLLEKYSDSIADSVRKLGYSFRPTSHEPIDYITQLNGIVQKSKTKYVQLRQLIKQLEERMQEAGEEKPKRETFERNLLCYEEMQGTSYNMDELSVSKYVMLEKKYEQKVEQIKMLHAK